MHKEMYFMPRTDLPINSNDAESLCIEIQHKKDKSVLSNGDMTVFKIFCEKLLSADDGTSKNIIFADDLNIDVYY